VSQYEIRALSSETWGAFADLCERHNGAGFGGCWCTWFHNATMTERRACGGGDWRGYKERLVSASFFYNATRNMCERAGCTYDRPKGKNHCIMRKVIEPS
jgi:hypothetical protein